MKTITMNTCTKLMPDFCAKATYICLGRKEKRSTTLYLCFSGNLTLILQKHHDDAKYCTKTNYL